MALKFCHHALYANCAHLLKYPVSPLSGRGFSVFNCYEDVWCEGIEFTFTEVKYNRPLQASIIKDYKKRRTDLALIYGSPADGMFEMLYSR